MENWGLITYRETSLLYKENESSTGSQQWVAIVVAHELAHQVSSDFVLSPQFSSLCSGSETWSQCNGGTIFGLMRDLPLGWSTRG